MTQTHNNKNQHIKHFVFFANASSKIGAGHIMRLYALAQVCVAKGISVTFASCQCPDYLQDKLQQANIKFVLLPEDFCARDINALNAAVWVIDDYYLREQQWQYFKASGALLVNIDDNTHDCALHSHIIINPSASSTSAITPAVTSPCYEKRAPTAQLLLGPSFALLRQEFVEQKFIPMSERRNILITLGGADVKNMTHAIANAVLKRVAVNTPVTLLIGGLQSHSANALYALRDKHPNVEIIENSEHVAKLMMRSGLAITAAGGTLAELSCMGTPSIALVSVDNQLGALQLPENKRWYEVIDVRNYKDQGTPNDATVIQEISDKTSQLWRDLCKRREMSDHARQIIDGKGCTRILEQIVKSLG